MASTNDRVRFLGWQRPGLQSALEYVLTRSRAEREIDLSQVVIVVPGGRVGRNLGSMLVEHAAEQRSPLSPPIVITPGSIADTLLELSGPFAGPGAARLAWVQALRSLSPEQLALLIPKLPERDDLLAWMAMGDMLAACHSELAAGMVLFGEVPERCGLGKAFIEEGRWAAAALVQEAYGRALETCGLQDVDLARIEVLRGGGAEGAAGKEVIVLGVSELSAVARAALGLAGERVTYLVFADEAWRGRFDECGCPRQEEWATLPLEIREEQIVFAESPLDQADCALGAIAGLGGVLAADQIAVGLADEELVPFIERRSQIAGAEVRFAGGRPVGRTSPWQLLAVIADYLEAHDFASLRALVRHPDIEHRLLLDTAGAGEDAEDVDDVVDVDDGEDGEDGAEDTDRTDRTEDWLDAMDGYAGASLHGPLTGAWHSDDEYLTDTLTRIYDAVERVMEPLREHGGAASPQAWAEPLLRSLEMVYAGRSIAADDEGDDQGRLLLGGCSAVRETIADLQDVPEGADADWPTMSASEAVRFVMQQSGEGSVPEDPRAGAIEMLGWLELPLDPAEAVVVVGMNQGKIPASFRSDPFLSDRLRQQLGISNSQLRFARDACVLTSLVKSRRAVTLIAGRRSAAGDAMWPSRLLTACPEQELATRARRFLGKSPEPAKRVGLVARIAPVAVSGFAVAPIAGKPVVSSMGITSFRTYLSSPYLFYLQNVLRLEECGDPGTELEAMSFGNLLHKVVENFGRSDEKHSTDKRKIERFLHHELRTLAVGQYGKQPRVAVGIQVDIAKKRLSDFADWQAERASQGWLIYQGPEWKPEAGKGVLMVDTKPMALRGRIDRIERHATTGQLAILDFKTGDKGAEPEKVHRGRDGWRDLQLPLYRHLASELGVDDNTVLGYVVIPKKAPGVDLLAAQWTADDLADADEAAAEVVRAVRRGEFADVGDGADEGTIFASLCGMNMLGTEGEDQGDEQGEETQ